jgi:hypothetical protein
VLSRVPFHNICAEVAPDQVAHSHTRRGRASRPGEPDSTEPIES